MCRRRQCLLVNSRSLPTVKGTCSQMHKLYSWKGLIFHTALFEMDFYPKLVLFFLFIKSKLFGAYKEDKTMYYNLSFKLLACAHGLCVVLTWTPSPRGRGCREILDGHLKCLWVAQNLNLFRHRSPIFVPYLTEILALEPFVRVLDWHIMITYCR